MTPESHAEFMDELPAVRPAGPHRYRGGCPMPSPLRPSEPDPDREGCQPVPTEEVAPWP